MREAALEIWRAGVSAVDSCRLVREAIDWDGARLRLGPLEIPADELGRIVVVGAGKAGVGMVAGLQQALPAEFLQERVTGWVNVPADCLPESSSGPIQLHAARPAGRNEPTAEGLAGTERILDLVSHLRPEDVCLVLLSGGGSALLPAPVAGISLEDKLAITRGLSQAGATIEELNLVRRALSRVKGGGLLRACRADRLVSLIISDVVGDPLETIASGPTIPLAADRAEALSLLQHYLPQGIPESVVRTLEQPTPPPPELSCHYHNVILGSNRVALQAAGDRAEQLGYRVLSLGSENTGEAAELGRQLIEQGLDYPLDAINQPVCLLCGGETTVSLAEVENPGRGGRNQEVALSALITLGELLGREAIPRELTLLAGGTDGEDGPTDAAGGFADRLAWQRLSAAGLDPHTYLRRHDAYALLQACDSLLITGPTHTNVMDLNVLLIHPLPHTDR